MHGPLRLLRKIARLAWTMMVRGERFKEPNRCRRMSSKE
jgi:hypothetical protein